MPSMLRINFNYLTEFRLTMHTYHVSLNRFDFSPDELRSRFRSLHSIYSHHTSQPVIRAKKYCECISSSLEPIDCSVIVFSFTIKSAMGIAYAHIHLVFDSDPFDNNHSILDIIEELSLNPEPEWPDNSEYGDCETEFEPNATKWAESLLSY